VRLVTTKTPITSQVLVPCPPLAMVAGAVLVAVANGVLLAVRPFSGVAPRYTIHIVVVVLVRLVLPSLTIWILCLDIAESHTIAMPTLSAASSETA